MIEKKNFVSQKDIKINLVVTISKDRSLTLQDRNFAYFSIYSTHCTTRPTATLIIIFLIKYPSFLALYPALDDERRFPMTLEPDTVGLRDKDDSLGGAEGGDEGDNPSDALGDDEGDNDALVMTLGRSDVCDEGDTAYVAFPSVGAAVGDNGDELAAEGSVSVGDEGDAITVDDGANDGDDVVDIEGSVSVGDEGDAITVDDGANDGDDVVDIEGRVSVGDEGDAIIVDDGANDGDDVVVIEGSVATGDDGDKEDGDVIIIMDGDNDGDDDTVVVEGSMVMGDDGASLRGDEGDDLSLADGDVLNVEDNMAVGDDDGDVDDGDALGADNVLGFRRTLRTRSASLSAMKMFPNLSTATPSGLIAAVSAGMLFPLYPDAPVPATVEMIFEVAFTIRIR
jgi:hypothetical protein